jgi:MarR family transcriptional repressor of mepA
MSEPTGCENQIGPKIKRLGNAMSRLFASLARENGLDEATVISGRIMGLIYFSDRDIFQKDVEDAFHITRSSVTSAVKLMEKKGYIRREPVAGDARLKKLTLTEKGMQAHESVMRAMTEAERITCRGLTAAEREQFIALCARLAANAENGNQEVRKNDKDTFGPDKTI